MVIVHCPKCRHVFAALGPPVAPFLTCPACGQALRMRPKAPGRRMPALVYRPAARRARRAVAGLLLFAAAAGGLVAWRAWEAWPAGRGMRPSPAASTQPQPPPYRHKSAYEHQQEMAQRADRTATLSPDRLFAAASPAVVRVLVRDSEGRPVGQGSGFFVSQDGWLVTNYHVIELAASATVMLENYTELPVEGVSAADREGDLALLKVDAYDLPCLLIATGLPPRIGRKVYAIGSPRGLVNTLSEGLISGHRLEDGLSVLQTTAAMSHGSSGGPLLTEEGCVVGVNSRVRSGGQNLNFAVPADRIRELLQRQGPVLPLARLRDAHVEGPVVAQLDQAWGAIDSARWDDARAILSRLARTHPDNPHVWFAWGELCRRTALYRTAVESFEAALRLKPDYAEACYGLGSTYLDQMMLADIIGDRARVPELADQARQALLRAAEFDPAGRTGREARAALGRYWPREFGRAEGDD